MPRIRCTRIRFVPILPLAVVVAALGCRDDASSPTAPEPAPALVATTATALAFYQVSAGGAHTCGVTTEHLLYCWGQNVLGEVGDGTTTDRLRPVAIAGTLRFRQVSGGGAHTCALTTDYRAYCWGYNFRGALGDGTTTPRLEPVPVAGGRQFRVIDAGQYHTCGLTTDNRAYCWGNNVTGTL